MYCLNFHMHMQFSLTMKTIISPACARLGLLVMLSCSLYAAESCLPDPVKGKNDAELDLLTQDAPLRWRGSVNSEPRAHVSSETPSHVSSEATARVDSLEPAPPRAGKLANTDQELSLARPMKGFVRIGEPKPPGPPPTGSDLVVSKPPSHVSSGAPSHVGSGPPAHFDSREPAPPRASKLANTDQELSLARLMQGFVMNGEPKPPGPPPLDSELANINQELRFTRRMLGFLKNSEQKPLGPVAVPPPPDSQLAKRMKSWVYQGQFHQVESPVPPPPPPRPGSESPVPPPPPGSELANADQELGLTGQ